MIVLCSVAAAGPEAQPMCCRECFGVMSHCVFCLVLNQSCLNDLSLSEDREVKAHLPALTFFFHHLASSLCSHESKIDRHIVQQLYLRANCHFA